MGTKTIEMKDLTSEMLDSLVYSEFEEQAVNVNNTGVEGQLECLKANGWTEENILQLFRSAQG